MPGLTPLTQGLHARLQPLLLFYVDAASMIDQDDPDWELLLAVVDSAQGEARVVRSRSVCGMGQGHCDTTRRPRSPRLFPEELLDPLGPSPRRPGLRPCSTSSHGPRADGCG